MLSLLVMHALFTLNCRVLHHHGEVLEYDDEQSY